MCKQVEERAEKDRQRDDEIAKRLGHRMPSGHRRYSVRRNPEHPDHTP